VDEIVVLDTGSVDKTRKIARDCGARVFRHEWQGDFSKARNRALAKATHPWILSIDCDEELLNGEILKAQCLALEDAGMTSGGVKVVVKEDGDEKEQNPFMRTSLFRAYYKWEGAIHERANTDMDSHAFTELVINHFGGIRNVENRPVRRMQNLDILLKELSHKENPYYRMQVGQELLALKQPDLAVYHLRLALPTADDPPHTGHAGVYRDLAVGFSMLDQFDVALDTVDAGMKIFPAFTDLALIRLMILTDMGDLGSALSGIAAVRAMGEPHAALNSWGGCSTWRLDKIERQIIERTHHGSPTDSSGCGGDGGFGPSPWGSVREPEAESFGLIDLGQERPDGQGPGGSAPRDPEAHGGAGGGTDGSQEVAAWTHQDEESSFPD
jgi:hypothetical protein